MPSSPMSATRSASGGLAARSCRVRACKPWMSPTTSQPSWRRRSGMSVTSTRQSGVRSDGTITGWAGSAPTSWSSVAAAPSHSVSRNM
ncbi:hypothetical protein ACFQYP_07420 [Nonomuraea antimicrobica]